MSLRYKASFIRAYMSNQSVPANDSMYLGRFFATSDHTWNGVWDEDEKKVIAVFNRPKRVLRVDEKYLSMLQDRKDWTVVGSKTLEKYAPQADNVSSALYARKIATPQIKTILETEEGEVEIDLGDDESRRTVVVNYIFDKVYPHSDHKYYLIDSAWRAGRSQKFTITITKPSKKAEMVSGGFRYTVPIDTPW